MDEFQADGQTLLLTAGQAVDSSRATVQQTQRLDDTIDLRIRRNKSKKKQSCKADWRRTLENFDVSTQIH